MLGKSIILISSNQSSFFHMFAISSIRLLANFKKNFLGNFLVFYSSIAFLLPLFGEGQICEVHGCPVDRFAHLNVDFDTFPD